MEAVLVYGLIVNVYGLFIMGIDKRKARVGAYRISERHLWSAAVLGGALGSMAGMYLFRHKTKHIQFKVGLPVLAILQAAGYSYLLGTVG